MKRIKATAMLAWSSRRAWWFTATSRTKERFARTALGSFWLGFSNLLSIGLLATVYGTVFRVNDFGHYVVYLGVGLVGWNAVSSALLSAPNLFRINSTNLKNTNLHPVFYTLEEWAFQMQTFFQSFALVGACLSAFKPTILLGLATAGLLPVANMMILCYWLPTVICIMGAEFEDFYQLVPIAVQLTFLLSPILYKKEALGHLGWLAEWNPLYAVIARVRSAAFGEFDIVHDVILLCFNLAGCCLAMIWLDNARKRLPFLV